MKKRTYPTGDGWDTGRQVDYGGRGVGTLLCVYQMGKWSWKGEGTATPRFPIDKMGRMMLYLCVRKV